MKVVICIIALIASCLSCLGQTTESLENEIKKLLADYNAIGASVVVVKDNKICYHHAFGYNPDYNDTTLRKPIPDDGFFWLASVSKTFISTAIMQLVEKKMVKIDDDVNKYLRFTVKNPYYPNVPITIRMLLCHRSSINDKHYGWTLEMMDSKTYKKYDECFNHYRPGTKFDYCNLNYSLLGAIIENVTGMRFDQYIDKYLCEPLGLEASFNLTKIDSTRLVKSLSFDQIKKKYKQNRSIYNYQYVRDKLIDYQLGLSTACLSPAGGMRMSAMDLANWMMVHMNYGNLAGKNVINKESELAMWTPQGADRNYGFAFSRYDKVIKGVKLYGMTGGSHGIHSLLFFNPEKKFGFVVICNGCTSKAANGSQMNYKIVRSLYRHIIKK